MPIKQILSEHKTFDDELFTMLLSRPGYPGDTKWAHDGRLSTIFLSDENILMDSLAHDFPEIITLGQIGESYKKRPIRLITLDARKFLVQKSMAQQSTSASLTQNDFIKPHN
jgi:hypothetical protein